MPPWLGLERRHFCVVETRSIPSPLRCERPLPLGRPRLLSVIFHISSSRLTREDTEYISQESNYGMTNSPSNSCRWSWGAVMYQHVGRRLGLSRSLGKERTSCRWCEINYGRRIGVGWCRRLQGCKRWLYLHWVRSVTTSEGPRRIGRRTLQWTKPGGDGGIFYRVRDYV